MRHVTASARFFSALALTAALLGCSSTRNHRADGFSAATGLGRGEKVLLVEPNIELTELLASGVEEARADWTLAARAHVSQAVAAALAQREAKVGTYNEATEAALLERQRQLILLNRAVGTSILLNRYVGNGLPHKGNAFDWTLGPGARVLDADARYALFVFLHDSYATSGRKALAAGLMLVGVGVSLGQQLGFASLVDLSDGRVVWFNLLSAQSGDLRNAPDAAAAVNQLLDGLPL